MFPALSIASNGLAVQGRKLDASAAAVASAGATQSGSTSAPGGSQPVRIGSLLVGDAIESLVSLKEVELAYKLNAAVIETANEMLGTLLDMLDTDERR